MFKLDVSKIAPFAKAVVAVGGVVILIAKAFVDGQLNSDEVVAIGTALAVAIGVYKVPNKKA